MQLELLIRRNSQALQYIIFGCLAAAVHLGVASLLIYELAWHPALANIAAWLLAFCVSFACHFRFTFNSSNARLFTAMTRYFFVSAAGFFVGEFAYVAGLSHTSVSPIVLLFFILLGVAIGTFLLSRYWAFAYKR